MTINDTFTAGQVWLKNKLEKEEWDLFDYERPIDPDYRTEKLKRCKWWKYLLP